MECKSKTPNRQYSCASLPHTFLSSSSFRPWLSTNMCSNSFSFSWHMKTWSPGRSVRAEAAEWTSHESLLCVLNAGTIQGSTYGFEFSGRIYWLFCSVGAEGDRVRGLCSDLSMFLRRSDTCTLPLTMRAQARYRLFFGSARISWWSLLKASLNIWSSL